MLNPEQRVGIAAEAVNHPSTTLPGPCGPLPMHDRAQRPAAQRPPTYTMVVLEAIPRIGPSAFAVYCKLTSYEHCYGRALPAKRATARASLIDQPRLVRSSMLLFGGSRPWTGSAMAGGSA